MTVCTYSTSPPNFITLGNCNGDIPGDAILPLIPLPIAAAIIVIIAAVVIVWYAASYGQASCSYTSDPPEEYDDDQ